MPGRALDPDAPTMSFNDPLRDVEPQAAAAAIRVLLLPVSFEGVSDVLVGHPRSDVRHREEDLLRLGLCADRDGGPFGAELDRVSDEVREHTQNQVALARYDTRGRRRRGDQPDVLLDGDHAKQLYGGLDQGRGVLRLRNRCQHPTGFKASFPFAFELRLRYALEGGALVLSAELANLDATPFPYALGFHPYLLAPLAGGARERCRVRLPAGTRLTSSDSWRTIGRAAAPDRTIVASDPELPRSIVLADSGARALEVEDESAGIATRVSVEGSDSSFPTWVAWSAATDAPYICLEPWTDAPNALNRAGTRTIASGERHRYRMTISLRPL